jgi:hypothetical protein
MNAIPASECYPWIVVPPSKRNEYIVTLEKVYVRQDKVPFIWFIENRKKKIIFTPTSIT